MMKKPSTFDELIVALSHIADLIRQGKYSFAEELLEELLPVADSIGNIHEKFAIFFQMARAYLMIGRNQKALELFDSIDEELSDNDLLDAKFYRLVIKIEKLRFGLEKEVDETKTLESIREGFERLISRIGDINIKRYYIAFLVMLWAPKFSRIDPNYTAEVLYDIINILSIDNDPQFAELLTTLAEIEIVRGNKDAAAKLIRRALRIYAMDPNYFRDVIRSILNFVKKFIPDKYSELASNFDFVGAE